MKYWIACAVLIAAPLAARAASPANAAGIWSTTGEVSGVSVVETCTFTQDADAKIAGSCLVDGKAYPTTGTVKEETVTWQHGGNYQGTDFIITYTGKLGTDGAITGTMGVDPFNVDGSFTSKKAAK
ncbi:hypothetical protein Terro_0797 [Terriglobus roseus DSM 18391]|uniref:DUF2147 domain-containing protein n=1 Tax=Terriglobus roseus (strain DSM 18391 / NRRL B-41598 / KBS 63) TaxID=926566 RepID=I3ZD11_TERRK|nr:hypothetical protein [Terriglobus roseus]AFL87129.1 hypothetical protein Terro_0797 [Terriglobus roseus DSM 18391]